jgi:DNA-binding transcriptional ArsR family regulator
MGLTGHPLPAEFAELIARRFAVLGEPTRIRLLNALVNRGEASVQDLAELLEAGHANVSKHLTLLHGERIVARRKAGTRVLYRIADENVLRLCDEVCGGIQRELRELGALLEHGGAAAFEDSPDTENQATRQEGYR